MEAERQARSSRAGDAPDFWQRGVIVVETDGDLITQSRFYTDPAITEERRDRGLPS